LKIFSGILPVKKEGTDQLAVREVIIDHSKHGGVRGLYSLSGVKLTTSRRVAQKALNLIFGKKQGRDRIEIKFPVRTEWEYGIFDFDWDGKTNPSAWQDLLKWKIENELVVHLQDLILRRTSIGNNPVNAIHQAERLSKLFDWDPERADKEINDLKAYYLRRGLSEAFLQ